MRACRRAERKKKERLIGSEGKERPLRVCAHMRTCAPFQRCELHYGGNTSCQWCQRALEQPAVSVHRNCAHHCCRVQHHRNRPSADRATACQRRGWRRVQTPARGVQLRTCSCARAICSSGVALFRTSGWPFCRTSGSATCWCCTLSTARRSASATASSLCHYQLKKQVYKGAISRVFEAFDRRDGAHVCLKVYKRTAMNALQRCALIYPLCKHLMAHVKGQTGVRHDL